MRSRIVSWLLGLCCAVLLLVIYMFLLLFLSISIEIKWVLLQNSSRPHQDEIFINNFAAIVPNALTYCSVCIVVIVCTFSDLIFCIISHLVRSFLGKTFFPVLNSQGLFAILWVELNPPGLYHPSAYLNTQQEVVVVILFLAVSLLCSHNDPQQ